VPVSLNPSLVLGEPLDERNGMGGSTPDLSCLISPSLHTPTVRFSSSPGRIQPALQPSEKLLLIPAGQAGTLGKVVESKPGTLSRDGHLCPRSKTRDRLAQQGENPPKKSLPPPARHFAIYMICFHFPDFLLQSKVGLSLRASEEPGPGAAAAILSPLAFLLSCLSH